MSFAVVVTVGLVKAAGAAADPDGPSTSALSGPLPCDSVLTQEITILPDLPATDPTPRSDKQKEVEQAAAASSASTSALEGLSPSVTADASPWDEEQPVPSYVENSLLDPGTTLSPTASTSSRWLPGEDDVSSSAQSGSELPPSGYALSASVDDGEDEEEYDGYEELSLPASLSGRAPPPRIDDDISPPSMGEPSSMRDYRPAPGYGTDRGDGDLFLSGGTPDSLQPPPHASERISGDSHDALDIPETPPPVVDYDLPFLGAAAASAVSEIGTLSTVMPPIESLGSSVPSTPPSPGADEATVPSYSGHAPTGVPSSPPPPVSPLDSDHPSLPPFSASPPAAYQAREESSSVGRYGAGEAPGGATDTEEGASRRPCPDGLPPPYAGQDLPARSPPPPAATSLSAAPPALPPRSPSRASGRADSPSRPLLPPPPAPPRSPRARVAPPATTGGAAPGRDVIGSTGQGNSFASSRAGRSRARPLPPVAPSATAPSEGGLATSSSGDGDDELRPPPYEQRDGTAAAAASENPSGIQWGMMMQNRRDELVL